MTDENKTVCPACQGKKVIAGTCECNMEWRGTQGQDNWQDCQCTPEVQCPTCQGTGYVDSGR